MNDVDTPLDRAVRRLERALGTLEARLADHDAAREVATQAELFGDDRARLAAELESARERERQLEAVAAEASAALGRAAAEVRAALQAGG